MHILKNSSKLSSVVVNYSNYNYIRVIYPKLRFIHIERINYKNIYIYYISRGENVNYIFMYNKSNKFYRLMVRKIHTTNHYIQIGDSFDQKVSEYFNFDQFEFIPRDTYDLPIIDSRIIDILKQTDL
jgi:hypothetical protein